MHGRKASKPFIVGLQVLVLSTMMVLVPTAAARCAVVVDGATTPANAEHIAPSCLKSFFSDL